MDQPTVVDPSNSEEDLEDLPLPYFYSDQASTEEVGAMVVIVSNPLEFCYWLQNATPETQWLQVENLLDESEVWAVAARKNTEVALDVVMSDPEKDFSLLYRLVDVRNVRNVRVSIPVKKGFLKALRLAASIQLPVRLMVEQPSTEVMGELREALEMYLHDPVVEAPVEFFHSLLSRQRGFPGGDLWNNLERDPAVYQHIGVNGHPELPYDLDDVLPGDFVLAHMAKLEDEKAECVQCRWRDYCRGYFKMPDPTYQCGSVIELFDRVAEVALEMKSELDGFTETSEG